MMMMMMIGWWWLDDDNWMVMFRWWWLDDDDWIMMIGWCWLDDDWMMMIRWWCWWWLWWLDDDDDDWIIIICASRWPIVLINCELYTYSIIHHSSIFNAFIGQVYSPTYNYVDWNLCPYIILYVLDYKFRSFLWLHLP